MGVTVGRYGSALGFEREDPAGLYTFSRAYDDGSSFNLGNVDAAAVEGVTVAYTVDAFSIAASFENNRDADIESDELDLEVSFSYTGIADTTIGGGYFFSNENTNAAANAETMFQLRLVPSENCWLQLSTLSCKTMLTGMQTVTLSFSTTISATKSVLLSVSATTSVPLTTLITRSLPSLLTTQLLRT